MTIDVKYQPGDVVKYISRTETEMTHKCYCCAGAGYIIGADAEKYDCPVCEGTKIVPVGKITTEEQRQGTICAIHVHYDSNSTNAKVQIYYDLLRESKVVYQKDIIKRIPSE